MPVFSMTGFGQGRASNDRIDVVVEIKSVNHRFLDVICKMSNRYSHLETDIIDRVKSNLSRGRVEVMVNISEEEEREYDLQFDKSLFNANVETIEQILKEQDVYSKEAKSSAVLQLLQKKEILRFVPKENDEQLEFAVVAPAVEEALEGLVSMRKREGKQLEKDLQLHLKHVAKHRKEIVKLSKDTSKEIQKKIEERLSNLDATVDPDRLAQEIAILADKADISEELARLESHISQFSQTIEDNEGGRKLEFILQEFVREVNTIGSKTQSAEISQLVVQAKAEIEKLREQSANVE